MSEPDRQSCRDDLSSSRGGGGGGSGSGGYSSCCCATLAVNQLGLQSVQKVQDGDDQVVLAPSTNQGKLLYSSVILDSCSSSSRTMLPSDLVRREASMLNPTKFRAKYQFTRELVSRLGLDAELSGHEGCVNCIQWNESGELLLSGSDDLKVNLWDPHRKKILSKYETPHTGNIFSVKFMPGSGDNLLASGAADSKVYITDANKKETIRSFSDHMGRVKRLEVCKTEPHLVWSAAEDGLIIQRDLRSESQDGMILANLCGSVTGITEAKCLSINPCRSELLAVGANEAFVRIYDRRMIKPQPKPSFQRSPSDRRDQLMLLPHLSLSNGAEYCCQFFVPGHIPKTSKSRMRGLTVTYVAFSPNGQELLANVGGEHIYLFSLNNCESSCLTKEMTFPDRQKSEDANTPAMNPKALTVKEKANDAFKAGQYSNAINLYNLALCHDNHPTLFCNRAAALMKRNWDGDDYLAYKDCLQALKLDPNYVKAHLRLTRCLLNLDELEKSRWYLTKFKEHFPEHAKSGPCASLSQDIEEEDERQKEKKPDTDRPDFPSRRPGVHDLEVECRAEAFDFTKVFKGHCNTTTDIKEANFVGQNGDFVMAGSDDGRFFIWDKATTNVLRVLEGDSSIVNCLQSHPNSCLVASSGIDSVVRLWSPYPESGQENERIVQDYESVTKQNQRRMNDPYEMFFLSNFEYPMDVQNDSDDEPIQCRTN